MENTLLSTKFYSTLPPLRIAQRPRLIESLNECLQPGCKLALVVAPAGYGKSTLVSTWLQQQSMSWSWLSLDEHDNQPQLFLSYLAAAVQKIAPDLEGNLLLQNPLENEALYGEILFQMADAIRRLEHDVILVLDDCHLLTNPVLLQLLARFIEHQPPQLHLVLCARVDLPLSIARLRVRRQLVEIRQAEMQFTPEEALDYLRNSMGLALSSKDGFALQSRTEGWIAGLQLAALSIRSSPDPTHFVQSFTGSDRFILEYLLDEVYSHLSGDLQDFLLRTSILERFSAPLCDAIRAVDDASDAASIQKAPPDRPSFALLDQVEHTNLFLIPLGNDTSRAGTLPWYRYHHLFADLLRHRLQLEKDSRFIGGLHSAASRWCEDQGLLREAGRHAFQVPDRTYATAFVERQGFHLVERSEVPLVFEWFRQLAESEIISSPWLCVIHAWALVLDNRTDYRAQVMARLAEAEQGLAQGREPGTSISVPGHIATIRAHLAFSEPNYDPRRVIALSQQALEILPEDDGTARSVIMLHQSYGYRSLSDGAITLRLLDEAEPYALRGSNYYGLVCCYFDRAWIAHLQGKLHRAAELCQLGKDTLPQLVPHIDQFLPAFHSLDVELGCLSLEWNQLEEADQYLVRGMHRAVGMYQYDVLTYPALVRLRLIQGNQAEARAYLMRLEHLWPDLSDFCQAIDLLFSLRQNPEDPQYTARAAHWVQYYRPTDRIPGFGLTVHDDPLHMIYLAWIQIQILLGNSGETLPVIERMLAVAEKNQMNHRVIESSAVQALALQAMNESEQALSALTRALRLAEPEGYIRTFDLGPGMQTLLLRARQQGIRPRYVEQILRALRPEDWTDSLPLDGHQSNHKLIEPLSDREMEVLRLLANGQSKAQIAARLYLSPNTLKAHTQNIYEKLGAHSRMEAVNRARELGIL